MYNDYTNTFYPSIFCYNLANNWIDINDQTFNVKLNPTFNMNLIYDYLTNIKTSVELSTLKMDYSTYSSISSDINK